MKERKPESDYTVWQVPGQDFSVSYSLSVFHEIDFEVNEGYRRIPHGGVEIGGVLFGVIEPAAVRIEAFRTISCEHAFGPSFVLSERDLGHLKEQIAASSSEPELQGLTAVGWFISHTRSTLRTTEAEARLFDDFFPGTGKVTVLVKPERFQATRFSFLVRTGKGELERDATNHAVILPLPGRAGRDSAKTASPANVPSGPVEKFEGRGAEAQPDVLGRTVEQPAELGSKSQGQDTRQIPRTTDSPMISTVLPANFVSPPASADPSPAPIADSVQEKIEQPAIPPASINPLRNEARERSTSPARNAKISAIDATVPDEQWERQTSTVANLPPYVDVGSRHQQTRKIPAVNPRSNAQLIVVLLFAAALGCVVGYWSYLQLPSPVITLSAKSRPEGTLILWEPEDTRRASYAAIRVDDGQQIPLTDKQKEAGQAIIPQTNDAVKIELIVQHWLRDSRGIVRYVKSARVAADNSSRPK